MASTFRSLTPLIPSGTESLEEALAFYRTLGFIVDWQSDGMAGIRRDAVAFNIVKNTNREWIENSSCSIGVNSLDEVYEEYRNVAARVGPLEMKPWGRREFHMIVPSGVCLQFYETD